MSTIIGMSLAVSSQAISFDILEELKLLKSGVGKLIIASGAVDDIFELFLLSIILTLINVSTFNIGLWTLILHTIIFILIILIFRRLIIKFVLTRFEKEGSLTSLFMGALIMVLLVSALSEIFGFGALVGALVAGVSIRHFLFTGRHKKPWEEHRIARAVHIIAFGFLVPIFFVLVGLNTDLNAVFSNLGLSVTLILIALIGTIGGSIIGVMLSKGSFKEGLAVGLGVSPKGDVELVLATLALQNSIINNEIYSAIIFMAFIVTFITSIAFRYLAKGKSIK